VPTAERNWSAERVRSNFRIDAFSGVMGGIYLGVIVAFLPVVIRRMGGSAEDVALVVAGPFIGHLFSPVFGYLLARFRPVAITAVTATLARTIFLVGVLVAATPFALAFVSVTMWIIAVAGLFIDSVPATIVFAVATAISLPGAIAFGRIRHDPPAIPTVRHHPSRIARDVWRDHRFRRLLLSFTIFGFGNLMNAALYPILLVDHFNAPNSFVGYMTALQAGSAVIAYFVWGRFIDRGSSLRMTVISTALVLLMPLGYLLAPSTLFLLPVAIVAGITNAGGDITFFTNIVQLAPRERVGDYAVAQSSLMGVRGTIAPFAASALLTAFSPQMVMVGAMGLMVAGLVVMDRAVRAATAQPTAVLEVAPA
jgi:MFS family permease